MLINTPKVLTVTDAAALAPCVDGVVMVAKPGKTRLREFQQALEQLKNGGARVLGVILNEVEPGSRKIVTITTDTTRNMRTITARTARARTLAIRSARRFYLKAER